MSHDKSFSISTLNNHQSLISTIDKAAILPQLEYQVTLSTASLSVVMVIFSCKIMLAYQSINVFVKFSF